MKRACYLCLMVLLGHQAVFAAAPPIKTHTCSNGLEVVVVEKHDTPLVTVEVAVKAGAMVETPGFAGLDHLYEHMFFKANKVIPSQEAWMARARDLGMVWNGTTQSELVNYFFTTTSSNFEGTMKFMHDAIVNPSFDPREFEKERKVVVAEIDRSEGNPYSRFYRAVDDRVWYKYPTHKDGLGTRESVLAATVDQMKALQEQYFVPNNAALMVVGDVDAEKVFQLADTLYVDWSRAPDPFEKTPLVKHPPLEASQILVSVQPVNTVTGVARWHGPSTVEADYPATYAADLLAYAVQSPASKFQQALVESGKCVRADFGWFTQRNTGPISLYFSAIPEKVDECIEAGFAEFDKMAESGYLSDEERELAIREIAFERARERSRGPQLTHSLGFWWASADLDYLANYEQNLEQSPPEEIGKFMAAYVLGKPFVLGIMLSREIQDEFDLTESHFEKLVQELQASNTQ